MSDVYKKCSLVSVIQNQLLGLVVQRIWNSERDYKIV